MSITCNIAVLLILVAAICSAQKRPETSKDIEEFFGQSTYPLRVTAKPSKPSFSRHEPFVFTVTFTNTSDASVFVNLGSLFSFHAVISTIKKDTLYETKYWMDFNPKGTPGPARREDYQEIVPRKSFTITVTSRAVKMLPHLEVAGITHPSWDDRKPGRLKLFLQYGSGSYFMGRPGEKVFFARQLEGTMNSNDIIMFVK